jgi:hypothetical protein
LVLLTGKRWNVQDGRGEHWASSRVWLSLSTLAGVVAAAVAVYSLIGIAASFGQESTTNYFWAGVSLIVITGYLATVAATWLFGLNARRRQSP